MTPKKSKRSRGCLVILVLAAAFLLLAALLAGAYGFFLVRQRETARNARPMVLIHEPLNHDRVTAGSLVEVLATARLGSGLRRVEVYADDALVAVRDAPAGKAPARMAISESWLPTAPGNHVLIVRAISAGGVTGQAAVTLQVLENDETMAGVFVVQAGDTLADIAAEAGTTPEDLADLNPELAGSEPSAGDELMIPEGEAPAADAEDSVPPAGGSPEGEAAGAGEPPVPEDDPPEGPAFSDLLFQAVPFVERAFADDAPSGLKLELPALQTSGGEENLHCYIGLGSEPPRWVPDADGDPATDESFTPLPGGNWDVQPFLAGDAAPLIYWPADRALPVTVTCVGVAGGGTDALDLGTLELSAPPGEWDGTTRSASAGGAEGSFAVQYRISRQEANPRGIPLYLDPGLAAPTNVHLDERRNSLRWDYTSFPDQENITGFRVYLNGSLQWVEDARDRESGLPYEWFNPPCGSTYTFSVSAYRYELPDGPESPPGTVSISTPAEGCQREVQINFLTLETFNLGSDGRYERRGGDVGPPYGSFFANEWQLSFDARSPGRGSSLDEPIGLTHNTLYNLGEIAADPVWRFSGLPYNVVPVPVDGEFEFGFRIMNENTGRCHDSDDPGCDDVVCEGMDFAHTSLDHDQEGTLTSENGRCRLTYSFGPAPGSPVGSSVPGGEPKPWINVEDVIIDGTTGRMQIPVRNTGTATWPWKDLQVRLQTRSGESLGLYTWENFALETGQRTVLEHPDILLDAPYDACVVIDPNNLVLEEPEATGVLSHGPVCPQMPDLVISDVRFDTTGSRSLQVAVQNIGESALKNRNLKLQVFLNDGTPASLIRSWPVASLEINELRMFELSGIDDSLRGRMQGGYSVVVDPNESIPESGEENNRFSVPGSARLKVWWCDTSVPHYHGLGSTVRLWLTADVLREPQAETVFEASRSDTITAYESFYYGYNHCMDQGCNIYSSCSYESGVFTVYGDEPLRITIRGDFLAGSVGSREDLGTAVRVFTSSDAWGSSPMLDENDAPVFNECQPFPAVPPLDSVDDPDPWGSMVCIGQLPP